MERSRAAHLSASETALAEQSADPEMELVHLRAVEYGCFMFEVHRA